MGRAGSFCASAEVMRRAARRAKSRDSAAIRLRVGLVGVGEALRGGFQAALARDVREAR